MQLTGVTINIMTLGGLAVAVGRVVDDAIVVLENIYRHRALGEDRLTASINGPREVAGAITASTLTTVAVFLPLGFVGGLVTPVLPAVRADRHVRAAGVAGLRADRRPGPRLLPHRRASSVAVDENGEPTELDLGPDLHADHHVRRCAAARPSSASSPSRPSCSSPRLALAPLLPTQFINAGSEKTLIVTVAPPTGASSAAVLEQDASRPRRSSSPTPTSSSSRRASRPRATRARRSSSRRSRAGPPTARR